MHNWSYYTLWHKVANRCQHKTATGTSASKSEQVLSNKHAWKHKHPPLSRRSLLSRCPMSRWSESEGFLSVLLCLHTTLNWTNPPSATIWTDPRLYLLQLKPSFCARIGNNRSLRGAFEEEEYPICCSRPRRTQQPISAPRTPLCSRCSFSAGQQTRSAGNPQNNSARTLRDRATEKKVDLIGN